MINNRFQFDKKAYKGCFCKNLLIGLLIASSTSLQASEMVKSGMVKLAGIATMCLGSKILNRAKSEDQTKMLELSSNSQPKSYKAEDREGKKLREIGLTNACLSKDIAEEATVDYTSFNQDSFEVNVANFIANSISKQEVHKKGSTTSSKSPNKMGSLKMLMSLFFISASIPSVEAGVFGCTACTTVVCAPVAPNPIAFGICVVEAASTICFFPCSNPIF